MTLPSSFSTSTVDESISPFDPPPINNHTQILTPDSTSFTPYHQHFPYPLFAPALPGKFSQQKNLIFKRFYFRFTTIIIK
jgi:hypothetical protein